MNRYAELALSYDGAPLTLMEVCGTHTMAIARHGLKSLLPPAIRLVSGPGCPVCVTDAADIDALLTALTESPGTILASFGDMLRVPGSQRRSLERLRADGADVRVVYSVTGALELARANTDRPVVFLGIGFETTAPGTAIAVSDAAESGLANFRVLSLHKLVSPALRQLLAGTGTPLSGFLLPGHVCAITGTEPYAFLPDEYGVGGVVAGFEPADILTAIGMLVAQRQGGRPAVEIQYQRAVAPAGNQAALAAMKRVFRPVAADWRGLGRVADSGLALAPEYAGFAFAPERMAPAAPTDHGCRCGEVLCGLREPADCPLFGTACTPRDPVGPCMVSSEGACAASFRYRGVGE